MREKRTNRSGSRIAAWALLRLPVVILLISAVAALTPSEDFPLQPGQENSVVVSIREDLAAVQMELMQVMQTDSARTSFLEQREKQLKYALRDQLIRNGDYADGQERNAPRVTASASASIPASSARRIGPSAASPEPKHPQSTCRPIA